MLNVFQHPFALHRRLGKWILTFVRMTQRGCSALPAYPSRPTPSKAMCSEPMPRWRRPGQ